jgi:hypothetical protein
MALQPANTSSMRETLGNQITDAEAFSTVA